MLVAVSATIQPGGFELTVDFGPQSRYNVFDWSHDSTPRILTRSGEAQLLDDTLDDALAGRQRRGTARAATRALKKIREEVLQDLWGMVASHNPQIRSAVVGGRPRFGPPRHVTPPRVVIITDDETLVETMSQGYALNPVSPSDDPGGHADLERLLIERSICLLDGIEVWWWLVEEKYMKERVKATRDSRDWRKEARLAKEKNGSERPGPWSIGGLPMLSRDQG